MRNQSNKSNKTKFIARVLLLILLLTSVFSLAACEKTPEGYYDDYDFEYSKGQNMRGDDATALIFKAVSDKNTFEIDKISFNIMLGTHANKYIGRQDNKTYDLEYYLYYGEKEYDNYLFAIYICDENSSSSDVMNFCPDDIESKDGYYLVKQIGSVDAFSDEYGYIVQQYLFLSSFYLKHIEEITIPQEFVNENQGRFSIKLVQFYKNTEKNQYSAEKVEAIDFEYEKTDENTVRINFLHKDWSKEGNR